MNLVYPPNGHQTYEESSFVIGSVSPESEAVLNGKVIPTSEKGFFSYLVHLEPGSNTIALEEKQAGTVQQTHTLDVERLVPEPLDALPADSTVWADYVFPETDQTWCTGEQVTLYCLAPEGAEVSCMFASVQVALHPTSHVMDTREGVFAQLHQLKAPWPEGILYAGTMVLPSDGVSDAAVMYTMQYQGEQYEVVAPGRLSVQKRNDMAPVSVTVANAVTRTNPNQGARRTPLLKNTRINVSGESGDFYRMAYAPHEEAWIQKSDVVSVSEPLVPEVMPIHTVIAEMGMRSFQVIIPMPHPLPMELDLKPLFVKIRLMGATSHCDFVHYKKGVFQRGLSQITWQQVTPSTMDITILLDSQLSGFQRYYDESLQALVCSIRTRRALKPFPFMVAIDPGHGGDETGATAPDGTLEKDLNLKLALMLKEALSPHESIQVALTRETDESLGLDSRVDKAIQADANLLLSLHHNALPDGRSPLTGQGVSTYYYYPFAFPMARLFQRQLVHHTDFKDYGVLYDSLHLCRVMEMPALLLECGFLSHLEDAQRCLDEAHQQKVVDSIARGIQTLARSPSV